MTPHRDDEYFNLKRSYARYENYATLSLICGVAAGGALLSEGVIYFFHLDVTGMFLAGCTIGFWISSSLAYRKYSRMYHKLWGRKPDRTAAYCNCGHDSDHITP